MHLSRITAQQRRPLVWLLVLALVVYGFSSTLLQLLGPTHRHEHVQAHRGVAQLVVAARDLVGAVHAWQERVRDSLPVTGAWHARGHANGLDDAHDHSHPHEDAALYATAGAADNHDHADFVRHHHAAGDSSVVALDGHGDDANGSAASGSAMLTLAMAPRISLPPGQPLSERWLAGPQAAWADALLPATEHPPRA